MPAVPGEELLELWALEGVATIARAGAGWCDAGAGDGPISVRMQRWTAEPPLPPGLDDLVETPYRARRPRVRPACVTGGFLGEGLDLGAAGLHRLRIGRTLGERGRDAWLLQFWPVPRATAPRWWARSRPAANHRTHQWWGFLDDWTAQELAQFVFAAAAELAGLLLAGPDDVRGALDHAVRVGRLRLDGDRDARFRLVATEPPTR